jgi:hypothetical protein
MFAMYDQSICSFVRWLIEDRPESSSSRMPGRSSTSSSEEKNAAVRSLCERALVIGRQIWEGLAKHREFFIVPISRMWTVKKSFTICSIAYLLVFAVSL